MPFPKWLYLLFLMFSACVCLDAYVHRTLSKFRNWPHILCHSPFSFSASFTLKQPLVQSISMSLVSMCFICYKFRGNESCSWSWMVLSQLNDINQRGVIFFQSHWIMKKGNDMFSSILHSGPHLYYSPTCNCYVWKRLIILRYSLHWRKISNIQSFYSVKSIQVFI